MTYAALAASGADDAFVPGAVAPIFPQIAAMKAGPADLAQNPGDVGLDQSGGAGAHDRKVGQNVSQAAL